MVNVTIYSIRGSYGFWWILIYIYMHLFQSMPAASHFLSTQRRHSQPQIRIKEWTQTMHLFQSMPAASHFLARCAKCARVQRIHDTDWIKSSHHLWHAIQTWNPLIHHSSPGHAVGPQWLHTSCRGRAVQHASSTDRMHLFQLAQYAFDQRNSIVPD